MFYKWDNLLQDLSEDHQILRSLDTTTYISHVSDTSIGNA